MTPLNESPFSRHFYVLALTGAWFIRDLSPKRLQIFTAYKSFMTVAGVYGSYILFKDLVFVIGDFKKVTWNLCISTLFAGSLLKNAYCTNKNQSLDRLRLNLHRDAESRTSDHYIRLHNLALRRLRIVERSLYFVASISIVTWLCTQYLSYLWGPREWPVPVRLPFRINMEDDFQYNAIFCFLGVWAVIGLLMIAEQELSMFTLLIQIAREYEVFLFDVQQLQEEFKIDEDKPESLNNLNYEINPHLRERRIRELLKKFSIRQQELIQYVEQFEFCYSVPLLLQFVVTTLLVVVSLIQCIIESGKISVKISYQLGYSMILLSDMFLICWYSTKLNTYICEKFYSSFWYEMSLQIQKDIRIIMMRSQNPPKITSGKMMVLNLHAFMILLRNVYSWLALFLQLEYKV